MNNPNPFIPQGTLLDQLNKKRARLRNAVMAIFGCTILLVGPLLLNGGCRRGDTANTDNTPSDTSAAMADTTPAPVAPPVAAAPTNTSNTMSLAVTPPTPQPVPAMVPPPAAVETEYPVVKGDTLATIAAKNHVKLKDLEAANPGVVPTKLALGMKLKIPASTTDSTSAMSPASTDSGDLYVVKTGDNLTKIATNHHTTVKELMALNNLKSTAIKAGEKLKVPASAAATTSAPVDSMPAATPTTTASNPTSGSPVLR